LLIVDDEEMIREMIIKYARFEGYEYETVNDGLQAVNKIKIAASDNKSFDLIVMDIMMPELDGFSAVKEIRKISDIPVLMLSARSEEYDKLHGFETGIDDYVTKPFSPKELMMRINAILKRSKTTAESKNGNIETADILDHKIWSKENLIVDLSARIVTVNGIRADMSPKEYDLLFYMLNNKDIALTREQILSEVWGYDFYGDDRTLDTHIKLLRKSLGEYSKFIVTLRSLGYRFDDKLYDN